MGLLDRINPLPGWSGRVRSAAGIALHRVERVLSDTMLRGSDTFADLYRRDDVQPPDVSLTQLQPVTVSDWGIAEARSALDAHEYGNFFQSARLAEAFGRDDRITGCLNTRVLALAGRSGIGFDMKPSDKKVVDDKTAQRLADEVKSFWTYSAPETSMSHVLRDAVLLGVAFGRVHWDLLGGKRVPRIEPWAAHATYWDWSIFKYRATAREGIFVMDDDSPEWMVFAPGGYRSWMYGAVRSLAFQYVVRQYTFRDWHRFCEKHGIPILAIREPSGNQWINQKNAFYRKIQGLGNESTIRLPYDVTSKEGFGIDYVEPRDRAYDAFRLLIERLDTNIAIAILGQNLSTEVKGGSYAAAQSHQLVRLDYLDADAQTLSTALRNNLIIPYLRFNYPDIPLEAAPIPTWNTRPPEDKQQRVATLKTFADVVSVFTDPAVQDLVSPDFKALCEAFDVPVLEQTAERPDAPAQVYAYHLEYGLLTKNEARRMALKLPPVKGGDVPPAPIPAAPIPLTALSTMGAHGGTEAQRVRARSAINQQVRSGKVKDPNDVPCVDCGHKYNGKDGVRHEYDHHKGYGDKHHLDVESVCTDCHKKRSLKEYGRLNALDLAKQGPLPTLTYNGITITIDRPQGFVQRGESPDGTPWERKYLVHYGFIASTLGGDGEDLDVFCGPTPDAPTAYWIQQVKFDGTFDEYKLMLGFDSMAAAVACYVAHVPVTFLGKVFETPVGVIRGLLGLEPNERLTVLGALASQARVRTTPAVNKEDLDGTYSVWASSVNMSGSELLAWSQTEACRSGGTSQAVVIARNLRLLQKAKDDWDASDVADAKRATASIARMRRVPQGQPVRKGLPSKRDISLMTWAYDPNK